jgi:hypothetical protein
MYKIIDQFKNNDQNPQKTIEPMEIEQENTVQEQKEPQEEENEQIYFAEIIDQFKNGDQKTIEPMENEQETVQEQKEIQEDFMGLQDEEINISTSQ